MSKIAIITGSVRPGRQSLTVAQWVKEEADKRDDAEYEIVDIADFQLPIWDEAASPATGRYEKETTRRWAETIDQYDGFVFVVAEYNHSITGALKNALDHLSAEFHNKAAGFVSYGSAGGARAVEHLRGILSEMQVAHVRNAVSMSLFTEFKDFTDFTPSEFSLSSLHGMLDQLLPWTQAMEGVRERLNVHA